MRNGIGVILLVLAGLLNGSRISASELPPPAFNPKTYQSLSGEFSLAVDPSLIYGQGQGTYRLTRRGKLIWSATHPFTLWNAAVGNDGVVAGYAYLHGESGYPPPEDINKEVRSDDYFHLVIFDPRGALRLNEAIKREASRILHAGPIPHADGLFIDEDNDRFVIRITDPDLTGPNTWRVYHLSTGERLNDIKPEEHLGAAGQYVSELGACPIRGTPLTLVNWMVTPNQPGYTTPSGKFTLIDLQGHPVWGIDLHRDYGGVDEKSEWRLRSYLWEHSAILSCNEYRRFSMWHVAAGHRVNFQVKHQPATPMEWEVIEVSRSDYGDARLIDNAEPEYSTIQLQYRGAIRLHARTPAPQAIHDIGDFNFDGEGRIGFIRSERDETYAFVLVQADGQVVRELPLKKIEHKEHQRPIATWLTNDQWLIIYPHYGVDATSPAWKLDVESGRQVAFEALAIPTAKTVVGTGDGGFIVLAVRQFANTADQDELIAFDAGGKLRWRIERDYEQESMLFSPEAIAVTEDGQTAILDNIRKNIQLFDRQGHYRRSLDLAKAFGQPPNYPSDIAVASGGDIIVHDFNGSPSIWRLNGDGIVQAKLTPRFNDGRIVGLQGGVKAAPDGRLWANNGELLLRLTDDGIVDRVLGRAPQAEILDEVVDLAVDQRGYFYAISKQTGIVHTFDQKGKFRHRTQPLPIDHVSTALGSGITVAGDGSIHVKGVTLDVPGYLGFDSKGHRIGIEKFARAEDAFLEKWYFKPTNRERWVVGYDKLRLIDTDGKLIRLLERRPNHEWLGYIDSAAVAQDGSIAVVSRTAASGFNPAISLFDPQGEPIHTIPLPFAEMIYEMAFNGQYIVLLRKSGLFIVDKTGSTIRRFVPKAKVEEPYWHLFFSPDKRELWISESNDPTRIQRYELPSLRRFSGK
ncbi:MAG: hypothetical protein U1F68_10115 [Gammaproteobacteria bacterium]